jgi:hypothetical protein
VSSQVAHFSTGESGPLFNRPCSRAVSSRSGRDAVYKEGRGVLEGASHEEFVWASAVPQDAISEPQLSHRPTHSQRWRGSGSTLLIGVVLLALLVFGLAQSATASADELTISSLTPDRYFSPNRDGQEDTASVSYALSGLATVGIVIRDGSGTLVRTVQSGVPEQGPNSFSWDGRKDNGSAAANGAYTWAQRV